MFNIYRAIRQMNGFGKDFTFCNAFILLILSLTVFVVVQFGTI